MENPPGNRVHVNVGFAFPLENAYRAFFVFHENLAHMSARSGPMEILRLLFANSFYLAIAKWLFEHGASFR
jgi:hypothetical protein